jgi:hypothetical protein
VKLDGIEEVSADQSCEYCEKNLACVNACGRVMRPILAFFSCAAMQQQLSSRGKLLRIDFFVQ